MVEKVHTIDHVDLEFIALVEQSAIIITASGTVLSPGWTQGSLTPHHQIQPPPDGIYEFDFTAETPAAAAGPVALPISTTHAWPNLPDDATGIRIHSATNSRLKLLSTAMPIGCDVPPRLGSGFITSFEVTLTATNRQDSGTDANLWLVIFVSPGDGQSDGCSIFLGGGVPRDRTRTFKVACPRGDFNERRCGGFALINGSNGIASAFEIESIEVIGIDERNCRWVIADWTVPPSEAWRRSPSNDLKEPRQSPVVPIPTMNEWQPE
jgi:hypothetical protein